MRSRYISQLLALVSGLVFFVLLSNASATTYYVRTDGNDANTGTGSSAAQAWATVVVASTKPLSPGDVVYIQAGTYLGPIEPTVDGTLGNPITFIADRSGSVSGWSAGDVIIQAPVGEHALNVSYDDYLTFSDFLLEGDSGRGTVDVDNGTGTVLQRCEIYGGSIGFDIDAADATIVNCLVRDNVSNGISLDVGTLVVWNSTIVGNSGDGVYISAGTLTVTNCIIVDNGDDGFDVNGGTLTHTYNLVYDNVNSNYEATIASTGEISVDPQFVSATDYRITILSPARNAGVDLSGTVDDDLEGRSRPYSGAYDIGCYEEGPIAHWKLDETSGTAATDSSGFSRDATLTGNPNWSTTVIRGGSLDFETSNGVDRVDAGNFDVTGTGLTVTAWIRQEDPLNDGCVITKSNGNGSSDQSWGLTIDENGELDFRVTAGGTWRRLQAPAVINPDKWYHVTGTYDGTTMRLYLDGQLIASTVHSPGGAIVGDTSHTVTLGDSPIGSRPFDGWIDDARIYDRPLSDTEILELYGLVGHWKLDETSGTLATDSSGLGKDGTYTNGPTLGSAGIYTNAVDFDGTDDQIDLPEMDYDLSDGLSISFWVKPHAAQTNFVPFFSLSNGQFNDDIWIGWDNDEGAEIFLSDTVDGTAFTALVDSTLLSIGAWQHYVMTIDIAGDAKIYRNGVLSASGNIGLPKSVARTQNMIANSVWSYPQFEGLLDDVQFYNRPLTEKQIAELYGLMGHWKLDETSGTTAADSSGLGNDGTYSNGPTLGSCGPYESAVDFDGIDDNVDLPDMDNDYSKGFSAAVWIKPSADPNTFYAFFGTANGATDNEIWFGYVGSFLELFVSDTTDGSASHVLLDNSPAVLDTWQHCAVTIDAFGNGKLYRNGVETVSGFVSLPANITRTENFIGKSVFDDEFPGELDDMRIYDRALTAKQVAELYGLVGHWKLDETSGTVAADATIFSSDGTYTNGVVLNRTGKLDSSADFDGTDDYVSVPDDSTLQMDDYFTMTAWIKPDASSNVNRMIINKEGEYEVALFPNDEIYWGLTNTDPGWSWHATGHTVTNGAWTHIAVTYNNATIKTYANGVLVDTYVGSGSIGDQYTSLNELRIGGRQNNPSGKYFDGLIDDVRVYSRSLCLEEIQDLHNSGAASGIRIIKWVETF